jgi:hypothetical protein
MMMMMLNESDDPRPLPRVAPGATDRATGDLTNSNGQPSVARDRVADASNDSFPASDPPSWTGTSVGPTR